MKRTTQSKAPGRRRKLKSPPARASASFFSSMSRATIQRNKRANGIKARGFAGAPRLLNGDHLTVPEFERRYWAMPEVKKAELIEGIVVMSPPISNTHGEAHGTITYLLKRYAQAAPG